MAASNLWAHSVLETLHGFQKQSKLCDFELSSKDGYIVPVHECVISATCPGLHTELSAALGAKSTVNVFDCTKPVLVSLVNLVYTGQLKSEQSDTDDVLALAGRLGVSCEDVHVSPGDIVEEGVVYQSERNIEVATPKSGKHSSQMKTPKPGSKAPKPDSKPTKPDSKTPKPDSKAAKPDSKALKSDCKASKPESKASKSVGKSPSKGSPLVPRTSEKRRRTAEESPATNEDTADSPLRRSSRRNRGKNPRLDFDTGITDRLIKQEIVDDEYDVQDNGGEHVDMETETVALSPEKKEPFELYSCTHCAETFAVRGLLTRHQKTHLLNVTAKEEKADEEPSESESPPTPETLETQATNSQSEPEDRETKEEVKKKETRKSVSKTRCTCPICGQSLSSSESLRNHQAVVHDGHKPHICQFCPKSFAQKAHLREHETWHTGETPHKCEECGKTFRLRKTWRSHVERHNAESSKGEFKCDTCDKVFSTQKKKDSHQQLHLKVFQCEECGKVLSSATTLKSHHRFIHMNLRPFKCSVCDKTFKQRGHCNEHEASHGLEKPFVCATCGRGFMSKKSVSLHETKCQGRSEEGELAERTCQLCNKLFKNAKSKKRHVYKKHVNEAGYLCSDCGKTLSTLDILRKHKEVVHLGQRNWSCTYCGKKFSQKSHLTEHIRIHTGDRPYVCPICQKSFSHLKNMKTHELVHTGVRAYECNYCHMTFKQKSALITHQKIHTKDRPFSCRHCGKTFALKQSMESHERVHTGERPYHCKYCDKTFARQSTARVHERCHTGHRPYKCEHCEATFSFHHKHRRHLKVAHNVYFPPKKAAVHNDEAQIIFDKENYQIVVQPTEDVIASQQVVGEEFEDQKLLYQQQSVEALQLSMGLDPTQPTDVVEISQEELVEDQEVLAIKQEVTEGSVDDGAQTYYLIYEVPVETDGEITVDADSALAGANLVLQ